MQANTATKQAELNFIAALAAHRTGTQADFHLSENERVVVVSLPDRDSARAVLRELTHPDIEAEFSLTFEPYPCHRTGHTYRVILEVPRESSCQG